MNIVLRNHFPVTSGLRRAALDESFERLMNSVFEGHTAPVAGQANRSYAPPVNVKETDLAFEVEAELPGIRKEDVKISIEAGRVSIEAESVQTLEQKEGEKVLRSERSSRKFARSFVLPEEVNEAGVDARLENGILFLTLPKKPAVQPKQITVR
jgi:HSP20 family protein